MAAGTEGGLQGGGVLLALPGSSGVTAHPEDMASLSSAPNTTEAAPQTEPR